MRNSSTDEEASSVREPAKYLRPRCYPIAGGHPFSLPNSDFIALRGFDVCLESQALIPVNQIQVATSAPGTEAEVATWI